MSDWTPEPWIDRDSEDCTHPVIGVPEPPGEARLMTREDYARALSAANFCAGTATEYLDGAGNLGRLLARPSVNAELLAACEAALRVFRGIPPDQFSNKAAQALVVMRDAFLRASGEVPPA